MTAEVKRPRRRARSAGASRAPTAARPARSIRDLDPRWALERPTEALALGLHSLRTGLFMAESLPLFWLQRAAGQARPAIRPPAGAIETLAARLRALLEQDAAEIGRGTMPLSVLAPIDPVGHGARLLRILGDSARVARRKRRHDARDFGAEARGWLSELPGYYRRNFHYQTDGYLSERSADLYEHQVELLFRGGADAMRRLVLAPMKAHLGETRGRGLRLLELGSGTGGATRSVARAFPEARITCIDLSPPYTRFAREQLRGFRRVECLQGDAADLDFADRRFDAVYSVFLFHELPLPVRELALEEALRVLKPGGFFGLVDSLQRGDVPELDWALDVFPREFHEPYYAHYAANPMEGLLADAGFEAIESSTGYLAKCIAARAPTTAGTDQSGR
ncbi:MAG: class I SAM-dependent methyltransferase [Myxococcota bacterium]